MDEGGLETLQAVEWEASVALLVRLPGRQASRKRIKRETEGKGRESIFLEVASTFFHWLLQARRRGSSGV